MTDREIAGIHHRNIEKANHSKNPLEEIQENCSVYETKTGEKFKLLCKRVIWIQEISVLITARQ